MHLHIQQRDRDRTRGEGSVEASADPRPDRQVAAHPAPQGHLGDATDNALAGVLELATQAVDLGESDGLSAEIDLEVARPVRVLVGSHWRMLCAMAIRDNPYGAFNFMVQL